MYLGKRVGQGQVCPPAQKVQAIVDFPIPQTKRHLHRFLGMAGYYRAFCINFSSVALPLTNFPVLRKNLYGLMTVNICLKL